MSSSTNPNISVYSIVLASCSSPDITFLCSYSCSHWLVVFQSFTSDTPILMAMLSDSIYKTLNFVCYLTCSNIDFDYCFFFYSTSGQFQHHSELPNSNFQIIGKGTLSSELTSELLDTDYRNTRMHNSRLMQCMSWSCCLNPLWIPTPSWVMQCTNS